MKPWKYKLSIGQYLTDDDSNDAVIIACNGVISELKKLPETLDDVTSIIYEFEELSDWAKESNGEEEWADDFNYLLEELYNWADYNRIWMGA